RYDHAPRPARCATAWSCSYLQRRRTGPAVFDAGLDRRPVVLPVPERLPVLLLDAAVGLRVVEVVGRIAMPRTPEQAGRLCAHHVPHRAAEAFTLGVVEHGEFVHVGAAIDIA